LSEKERENVWELVSSYSRLGYVLHNYPRAFLYLNLKTKFLKWYAEGVIDTWKRVRLYVYKVRIDKPERSEVAQDRNLNSCSMKQLNIKTEEQEKTKRKYLTSTV
jgi:hypothetical protein